MFDFSRRITRFAPTAIIAFAASLAPSIASAQVEGGPVRIPTGVISVSGALQLSTPRGDFAKNTDNGFGINAGALFRIDENAILNWRVDAGFLTTGSTDRRIPLAGTGGLIQLDLTTSHDVFTMVTGPQLGGSRGPFMPYVTALGGFSVFSTQSSIEGTDNDEDPFARTTNSRKVSWAYGAGAGTYIRVYGGNNPVRLELGARLLRHDNAEYLNEQRINEAFENDRAPIPIRSRADFVSYFIGVNVWVF